jgi:DMSO reductase anchor subunit
LSNLVPRPTTFGLRFCPPRVCSRIFGHMVSDHVHELSWVGFMQRLLAVPPTKEKLPKGTNYSCAKIPQTKSQTMSLFVVFLWIPENLFAFFLSVCCVLLALVSDVDFARFCCLSYSVVLLCLGVVFFGIGNRIVMVFDSLPANPKNLLGHL